MNAFRCLRVVARPTTSASTLLRPRIATPHRLSTPSSARQISLLTPRRPILPRTSTLPLAGSTSFVPSTSETLDLASKISSHPGLGSTQIRCETLVDDRPPVEELGPALDGNREGFSGLEIGAM
ncbi:uncharacterized protein ALTATR162_LOCUS8010 [Alternaria atra]|uniref:Uncharacterized protein n=1 Tax=Alternaria atra TaxID=119953 RepID=A0A8J2I9L5_9PLEO|nr:uncharacterized protein ALTATR162_LOCUS8010 [Alternaria atra]CAG5175219.1 unnamed protein product [Alternaria atra]